MDKYIEFVMTQASKSNNYFIMDTGEGRDTYDNELNIDIEDLSGWLIPIKLKDEAISVRLQKKSMDDFKKYYCLARWYYDSESNLKIDFKRL